MACTCLQAMAQQRFFDSMKTAIAQNNYEPTRLRQAIGLSLSDGDPDSLLPYVMMSEKLAAKTSDKRVQDSARLARSYYFIRKNYVDSALTIADQLIATYQNNATKKSFYLDLLLLRARILDRGNRYAQSIRQLYKVIETAEAQQDTLKMIQAKTGIGWVQMEMEQYNEAKRWLNAALRTSANKKFLQNYGALYSNLASTYNALGNADSAFYFINIAIADASAHHNGLYLATALSIQAKIFTANGKTKEAEHPLKVAVEIRRRLNDPFYTVYDMSALATYYAANNQSAKGIALCREGIQLATQSGLSSQLLMMYHALALNYKARGRMPEYAATLESILKLKDSFNNINASRILADMQASSDMHKQQATITAQKLDLTLKNYWLVGSAVFGVLLATILYLIFTNYRRRQSQKMQLALQEEKRIAAQSILDAEENERKRIASDLHDNIGAYASAIKADVDRIKDSGIDNNGIMLNNLRQHSQEIINSLGDTIWVLNKENITVTGISDRIKNYVTKLQPSYPGISINITEDIVHDSRINSQKALNIFRILQEAIHNALKHSIASQLNIHVESHREMRFSVSDNGLGLRTTAGRQPGNGLQNMKSRAIESGFVFLADAAEPHGTVIQIAFPTTN